MVERWIVAGVIGFLALIGIARLRRRRVKRTFELGTVSDQWMAQQQSRTVDPNG
jgi:hypothetical protein